MMELCGILGINVNELLTGERIIMENYQKKAEENLVELQKQKEQANKMKRKLEILWGGDCNYSIPSSFSYKLFLS